MRFERLTPNQFARIQDGFDTLLVSAYCPLPLDPAVSHLAAVWIGQRLADGAAGRFQGRAALWPLGHNAFVRASDRAWLADLRRGFPYGVRHGVLVTDRTLTDDVLRLADADGADWLIFDWWQWLRRRVPAERLPEAWAYLNHACPAYAASEERLSLGLPDDVMQAMAAEGQRLFSAMEEALSRHILALWA